MISTIGRGSYSFVYKVKHRTRGNFAALKVIDKKQLKTKKGLSRLKREISVHSMLSHRNIVKLYKHFQDQSNYYLLMEFCEGEDLYRRLGRVKERRLSVNMVKFYGFQLAQGVEYLHCVKKVIHHDLKLGNIFVDSSKILVSFH